MARLLLESEAELGLSVSATTRPPRPGEVDGRDYHFVDEPRFTAMVEHDEFLEWAPVFGHRYGTPRAPVLDALDAGRDILFDIDWQGTQQLHASMGEDLVRVFILPPSMTELERRLRDRRTDADTVIAERMRRAAGEISHWAEYDYVLVNEDVHACATQVRAILHAERMRRARRPGLVPFVRSLIG